MNLSNIEIPIFINSEENGKEAKWLFAGEWR